MLSETERVNAASGLPPTPQLGPGQRALITLLWQIKSHHILRDLSPLVAGVSPFPHVPKSLHCSFLSPTVLPVHLHFLQDHPHLQFHCTPFLSMVSGFPHSPPTVLRLFIALAFLPWFQSFLIHPPCSQSSPALPHFQYSLRASRYFLVLMAPLLEPFPGRTQPKALGR